MLIAWKRKLECRYSLVLPCSARENGGKSFRYFRYASTKYHSLFGYAQCEFQLYKLEWSSARNCVSSMSILDSIMCFVGKCTPRAPKFPITSDIAISACYAG